MNLPSNLGAQIATALSTFSGQWVSTSIFPNGDETHFRFSRVDDLTLIFSHGTWADKGKIKIRLQSPQREDKTAPVLYRDGNKFDLPCIQCSETKTPEQIASDIARRLLPEAELYFSEAIARIAGENAALKARESLTAHLVAAIGEASREDDDANFHFTFGSVSGEGHSGGSGKTADLSLRSIPAKKAVELAQWIKANLS